MVAANSRFVVFARETLRVLAIVLLALIIAAVVHKGFVDISAIAKRHSGGQFWVAVAQYVIANLAGGKKPDMGEDR